MMKKLDKIFYNSKRISIDEDLKIVIMSDCHRGAGDNQDNFINNQNIFDSALDYYYKKGFIYVELGDGDELWEVKKCKDIVDVHLDTFKKLKKFNDNGRLIMIYGNHDMIKHTPMVLKECFYEHYNKIAKQNESLLDILIAYESLVVEYDGHEIFLIHGHQVDFINGTMWKLSRFIIRYLWKPLEYIGIKEPISAAKNHRISKNIERRLEKWSIKNNKIIISGHTHKPVYPKVGESLYFNTGSCIHPNGITSIEIENGNIALVRWEFKINKGKLISVKRNVLEKEEINNFFK